MSHLEHMSEDLPSDEDWTKTQNELKKAIVQTDTEQWQTKRKAAFSSDAVSLLKAPCNHTICFVAGFDLSFPKSDPINVACVGTVVCRMPTLEIVYTDFQKINLNVPYKSGFLAFREADPIIKAYEKLQEGQPDFIPQAVLIDGNGILHKNGCGLACHVGVSIDVPTVGVAKNLHFVDGIGRDDEYREQVKNLVNAGDSFPLINKNGQRLGLALKTTAKSSKPVYISVGHKISLDTASWLVTICSKNRVPEPIRQADILSREFLRKELGS